MLRPACIRTIPRFCSALPARSSAQGDGAGTETSLDALYAANPGFRSAEAQLVHARALESRKAKNDEALADYRRLIRYYPGEEARCRYAQLLQIASGQDDEGRPRRVFRRGGEIRSDGAPKHYQRAQKDWGEIARRGLSTVLWRHKENCRLEPGAAVRLPGIGSGLPPIHQSEKPACANAGAKSGAGACRTLPHSDGSGRLAGAGRRHFRAAAHESRAKRAPPRPRDCLAAAAPVRLCHKGVPYLTFGLIALLFLVFWGETQFTLNPANALEPSVHSLVALGGLDGTLIFHSGQWWRLFTAPLLHGGVSHIVDNAIALLLAGWIFERLIGPSWFAALFVVSALGGSLGSLAQNSGNMVSVGASGAITGLLAAAFTCSFIFESVQLRARMQRVSLRLLVPALLPALLPFADSGAVQTDYGAHIGGAIAGGLMGFLLGEIWPETSLRPQGGKLALAIALSGVVLSAVSFGFVAANYSAYAAAPVQEVLIPPSEVPDFSAAAIERSADLVERYPHDPRAHLLRGTYFLHHHDLADAERQLRAALNERDILANDLQPQVEEITRATLALVLVGEGRKPEALVMAAPVCTKRPTRVLEEMRKYLDQAALCK